MKATQSQPNATDDGEIERNDSISVFSLFRFDNAAGLDSKNRAN